MEKKYTLRELIGMAGAAAALMGGGVAIAPKNGNTSDLHEYVSAQAVRDSIRGEDMRRISASIDTLNRKFEVFCERTKEQNDSTRWALKNLSEVIKNIDRNGVRYGMMCDNHSDRVANR